MKYPRYLADLEDTDIGFKSAVLRIGAEKEILEYEVFSSTPVNQIENARLIARSSHWMQLFFQNGNLDRNVSCNPCIISVFDELDIEYLFANHSTIQKMTIFYMLFGLIDNDICRNKIFEKYKKFINIQHISEFFKVL